MDKYRKGLYAGSFDPYTNGHHAIVRKAAGLFDELHVMIAANSQKKRGNEALMMKDAIEEAVKKDGLTNVKVVIYDGLVADYCDKQDILYYIRGLRNNMDYNYEENIAQINNLINPRLETIYMRSDNTAISSTMVRELLLFDRDVSPYVPESVMKAIGK